MNSQYIKASVILKKIEQLEEERFKYFEFIDVDKRTKIDSQIEVLKEILKPQ